VIKTKNLSFQLWRVGFFCEQLQNYFSTTNEANNQLIINVLKHLAFLEFIVLQESYSLHKNLFISLLFRIVINKQT